MAKKITIYTTPTCHYCNLAKDFFAENDVAFESVDVLADLDKRKEMQEKSGQLGVPVIDVDGEVIVGFDEERLRDLLAIQG